MTTNKTEKYSIYEVFDSFSWFNEYVSKLFNAAEILDLNDLDFNDYETAKEIIDLEYVKTRIENFFKFITTDIKYTIEENRGGWRNESKLCQNGKSNFVKFKA